MGDDMSIVCIIARKHMHVHRVVLYTLTLYIICL